MLNIDRLRNSRGELWLNVASSIYVLESFVNLDNHVFMNVPKPLKFLLPRKYWEWIGKYEEARRKALLIRHDCRARLQFPDDSVDHVLCSHFLEHVYPDEARTIIRDFYRVLKSGGTLHVIVPNIKGQALDYMKNNNPSAADEFVKATLLTRESKGTLKYRLMEFRGSFGLQHRWMYDQASMTQRAREAGFTILEENNTPSRDFRAGDGSVHVVGRKS